VSATDLESGRVDYLTLDQQVCFALGVASRSVISLYRPLLEPLGLTHPQYLVMVALWQDESLSVKEISARLQLEPPSVSPVLKRLEVAGLIERQRDAADERTVRLSLTERGRALRAEASHVPEAMLERLAMGVDELVALRSSLLRVISSAESAEGRRRVANPEASD